MAATKFRGKWIADFRLPDGTRVKRVSPLQTKRGAEEFERQLRLAASSTSTPSSVGAPPAPDAAAASETAFDTFAVEWLKTYAVVNNKPSEVIAKESILRVHLIPFFGNRTISHITPREVERYKAEKLKPDSKGGRLSPKSVNNHLTVLRKLLATAEEWGLIDRIPKVRRLKVPQARFDWLNAEETDRFLVAVEKQYPQWYVFFLTALRTGMRRGEVFALHWEDVDLRAGHVTVRRSVFRGRLGTPKGDLERTIPLTSRLRQALQGHQLATRMKGDLVFPGSDGVLSNHQDHVDRPLHGALKLAGLRRIRFHDLRHSFASQLVSAGRSLKEVQELLGHQSIQMTMRYAHLAPERMREAIEVLEGPAKGPRNPVWEQSGNILGTFWEHERKKPGRFLYRASF